ncbi:MAG: hypothetical protein ABSH05_08805 [Bryobacteraceae bacterium]|jgi:hypothetical protein
MSRPLAVALFVLGLFLYVPLFGALYANWRLSQIQVREFLWIGNVNGQLRYGFLKPPEILREVEANPDSPLAKLAPKAREVELQVRGEGYTYGFISYMLIGGLIRLWVRWRRRRNDSEPEQPPPGPGMLGLSDYPPA